MASFCQTEETNFLNTIDGSFVVVLIDGSRGNVLAATDLRSLIPVYYVSNGDHLALSWRVGDLIEGAGMSPTLSLGSVLSAVANGTLLGDNTYYREIRRLGPGQYILRRQRGVTVNRYWQRQMTAGRRVTHEELAACITRAVEIEMSRAGERTTLALSGGIDSRSLLAAAMRLGIKPDSYTCGWDRLDLPFGDFQAGRKLAAHAGSSHREYRFDPDELPEHIESVAKETDGMMLHVGEFSVGEAFLQELSRHYATVLMGSQCFGMGSKTRSLSQALLSSGIRTGMYIKAAANLFARPAARQAMREYHAQLDELLGPYRSLPTDQITDVVDYVHTTARMVAAQHGLWVKHVLPSCPLVTRPVLDLANRLTAAQRADKSFFVETVQSHLWPGDSWPTNTKHSRIDWRTRVSASGTMARGLADVVLAPGRVWDYLDRDQVSDWLRTIMPAADLPRPRIARVRRWHNRLMWKRTRAVQLAYLAVVKSADL